MNDSHSRGWHTVIGILLRISMGILCLLVALRLSAAPAVIVAPVKSSEFSDRLEVLGTTRANESVAITSSVTEKIVDLRFDDGDLVSRGQVLVVLEKREEEAILSEAEALLDERRLALNRLLKLERKQLAATEDLDQRKLEVDRAASGVTTIRARIDDRIIRAPFAGVVGLRNISLGALVEPGDVITQLDDVRTIKLDFTVPARYLTALQKGMGIEAKASALGNKLFQGRIGSIDTRVDPVTRAINVRALLPNPDLLIKPGLLMQVVLLRNPRTALLIPEEALMASGSGNAVMVLGDDNMVDRRTVTIGTRQPGVVEILSGLQEGEQVITHGQLKVRPGTAAEVLGVDDGTTDISVLLKGSGSKAK